jgi:sulfide:quinone oxidoreductase
MVVDGILGRPGPSYEGTGVCYLEMGDGLVGKVDANFLGGPTPQAPFLGPTRDYRAEKAAWAADVRARWFAGAD